MRTSKSNTPYREEWAQAVRAVVGERTYRQVARTTHISVSYLADWVQGKVPTRERVLEFARATGADPSEMLVAAGYEPLSPFEQIQEAVKEVLAAGLTVDLKLTPENTSDLEEARKIIAGLRGLRDAGKL